MSVAQQAARVAGTRQPAEQAYPGLGSMVVVTRTVGLWRISSLVELPPCQAQSTRA